MKKNSPGVGASGTPRTPNKPSQRDERPMVRDARSNNSTSKITPSNRNKRG